MPLDVSSDSFARGHTFRAHPVGYAAALGAQRIVRVNQLLNNVHRIGAGLQMALNHCFGGHRYVGNLRGRGLFWGLEFVAKRPTKRESPQP